MFNVWRILVAVATVRHLSIIDNQFNPSIAIEKSEKKKENDRSEGTLVICTADESKRVTDSNLQHKFLDYLLHKLETKVNWTGIYRKLKISVGTKKSVEEIIQLIESCTAKQFTENEICFQMQFIQMEIFWGTMKIRSCKCLIYLKEILHLY